MGQKKTTKNKGTKHKGDKKNHGRKGKPSASPASTSKRITVRKAILAANSHGNPPPSRVYVYAQGWSRFEQFLLAHQIIYLDEVTSPVCQAWIRAPRRNGDPVASSTEKSRLSMLREFFRVARNEQLMPGFDPTVDIHVRAISYRRRRVADNTEIQSLHAATTTHPDVRRCIVQALQEATATSTEIAALDPAADVDLDAGSVHFASSFQLRERWVPLTEWGLGILRDRAPDPAAWPTLYNPRQKTPPQNQIGKLAKTTISQAHLAGAGIGTLSVRAWRGRQAFDAGTIDDARGILGFASLDATERLIFEAPNASVGLRSVPDLEDGQ